MSRRPLAPAFLVLGSLACGGGASTPTQPLPTPSPGYPVTAIVYYDQNNNGRLDSEDVIRLPNVEVTVGGLSARTAGVTGQAVVTGVPAGTQTAALNPQSLPPFFAPGAPVTVQVPQTAPLQIPAALPIGENLPNTYLAFGDSITRGQGSSDGNGYRVRLEGMLGSYFGGAQVYNDGRDGTFSAHGAARITRSIERYHNAYTLIHYGSNDWNLAECKALPVADDCYTVSWLTDIVEGAKSRNSLPVLATIIPANPATEPAERNQWIDQVNASLKVMAGREGAVVADLNAAFRAAGDVSSLLVDDVHPNDAGYQVMAQGFFNAITQARGSSPGTSGLEERGFGWSRPGRH
jgi:lysophospholipase L1-like esterase